MRQVDIDDALSSLEHNGCPATPMEKGHILAWLRTVHAVVGARPAVGVSQGVEHAARSSELRAYLRLPRLAARSSPMSSTRRKRAPLDRCQLRIYWMHGRHSCLQQAARRWKRNGRRRISSLLCGRR